MAKDPYAWVIKSITERVARDWGDDARHKLGDYTYEAFLNGALLVLVDQQDDRIDPAIALSIVRSGRRAIIEIMYPEEDP